MEQGTVPLLRSI